MSSFIKKFYENRNLKKLNINIKLPKKSGVLNKKRNQEIIISLTSFPERIDSCHLSILSLLNQDLKPDRIILWLAEEQFSDENILPKQLLDLKKYGLEIKWYHDIKAYKKIIPTLIYYPEAIIVTVDDDWYYQKNMLKILIEEHEQYPEEIICHAITHPKFDENGKLKSGDMNIDYRGVSSYFNKILGGSGVLFPPHSLDREVLNEKIFMKEAPTNDDIWIWGMAVKNKTLIRLATDANGLSLMTNVEVQTASSLSMINENGNLYEEVTNKILEIYPEIYKVLKTEMC